MDNNNVLEMEARLKDFVSSQLLTIQGNISTFAKEGAANFAKLTAAQKLHEEQTTGMTGVMNKFQNNLKELPEHFLNSTVGALAAFAAFEKLKEGFVFSVEEGNKQIEAERGLEAILKTTGLAILYNKDQLIQYAEQQQMVTRATAMQVEAAEGVLITFDKIGKDIFPQTIKASQDLAAFLGTDLPSAATKLGQALEDPLTASRRLRAMNILLTESQKDQIKTWMALGDQTKAQEFILDQIQNKIGGFAEASTTSLDILKNKVEEIARGFGHTFVEGMEMSAASLLEFGHTAEDSADKTLDVIARYQQRQKQAAETEIQRINEQHVEEMAAKRKHLEEIEAMGEGAAASRGFGLSDEEKLNAQKRIDGLMEAEEMRFQEFMRNYQTTDQKALIESNNVQDSKAKDQLLANDEKHIENKIALSKEAAGQLLQAQREFNAANAALENEADRGHENQRNAKLTKEYLDVEQWYNEQKDKYTGYQSEMLEITRFYNQESAKLATDPDRLAQLKEWYGKQKTEHETYNQESARLDEILALKLQTIQINGQLYTEQDQDKQLKDRAAFKALLAGLENDKDQSGENAEDGTGKYAKEQDQVQRYYDEKNQIISKGEMDGTITTQEGENARTVILQSFVNKSIQIEKSKDAALKQIALAKLSFDLQVAEQGMQALEILYGKNKAMFLVDQSIALAKVYMQTQMAVTADNSAPYGAMEWKVPYDYALGAAAAAVILAQTIQGFETGGLPQGRDRLVRVNENGQEAILNALATRNLGREGVDSLNAGKPLGRSVQISHEGNQYVFHGPVTDEQISQFKQADSENRMEYLRALKRDMLEIEYHGITG